MKQTCLKQLHQLSLVVRSLPLSSLMAIILGVSWEHPSFAASTIRSTIHIALALPRLNQPGCMLSPSLKKHGPQAQSIE
ncbi:hypothetical protein RvY_15837 [Ramazzottius varieornatus]|uniref:Uncharacterized protein n=1 Tax=Ramazzottius varieornatus TaxID=947166 RepID=A0A1D1VWC0_RAMVA|nr:hypothetical protein RvY_15837 [Ramazzottius varieornatus]